MRRTYLVINHTIVTCWVICVLMVLLVPGSALWAQISSKPFASVEQAVNAQRAGWAGDKSKLSAVFDQERRRLRDQFEPELLKWLGQDPERHYWISSFLKADSYLHGNKRLPQLSLLVMEQGLTLVRNKDVEEIQGYVVRFSILAATLSAELGFSSLAASHKSEGEALLKRNSDLSVFVPGMNEADRRLYESIRSTVVPPPTVIADPNPRRRRICPAEFSTVAL